MYPVQVLPLRPEQEGEPLARRRFEELNALSAEEIRAQLERARRAVFSRSREVRKHFRKHGEAFGVETEAAYLAAVEEIQRRPERVFSGYNPRVNRPDILFWAFSQGDLLVYVGEFREIYVLTTAHSAKVAESVEVSLERFLQEDPDGWLMVELEL